MEELNRQLDHIDQQVRSEWGRIVESVANPLCSIHQANAERIEAECQRLVANGMSVEDLKANYTVLVYTDDPCGDRMRLVTKERAEAIGAQA